MCIRRRRIFAGIRQCDLPLTGKLSNLLAKSFLPPPRTEVTIRTLHGFRMTINPVIDAGVERSLYRFGTYEAGTLYWMKQLLAEGGCFADVGANIGLMSLHASRLVGEKGRVIAFEPNPVTRELLLRNIALNGCNNIRVESYAISAESKEGKIYDRWDVNRGGATLIKPSGDATSYDIREISLTAWFEGQTGPDLVKIDIEGYELEALKGARGLLESEKPPVLIIECSAVRAAGYHMDVRDIFDLLTGCGYRVFKSKKEKIKGLKEVRNANELPLHDNIYCLPSGMPGQLERLPF
ncbi:MAG TPA: FkbM family methyltransferase [Bacteroidales bacterium]|nr:FkbM family methyltransferase [Bacteroidales bacterium]HSA43723.1 FkbM family methyltransferase [Bacteroidales bacterium]